MGQTAPKHLVLDTVIEGRITASDLKKITYVPVAVPLGVTSFHMKLDLSKGGNVLNIGVFDPHGIHLGAPNGFRGWAGGNRKAVTITEAAATTSYIPGPIYPGIWNVILVPTTIKEEGFDWKLHISLGKDTLTGGPFQKMPAKDFIHAKPGWYRGDLHMHDIHSDGIYQPQELVAYAKEEGLQFMVSTNHNTNAANLSWGRYQDQDLLILNGEEITPHEDNHWNAAGISADTWIDWRYDAASGLIERFQQQVRQDGGICIMNHPYYDTDSVPDTRYPVNGFDAIEVWNGPWDRRDHYAVQWWDYLLQKGIRKTATGGSDSHKPKENLPGHPQTVVYAAGLNRKAIMEGIKKGRCYLAENKNLRAELLLNRTDTKAVAGMGETLHLSKAGPVMVHCKIEGAPGATVRFLSNKGLFREAVMDQAIASFSFPVESGSLRYVRVEVRRADGAMLLLTNPVWIDHAGRNVQERR